MFDREHAKKSEGSRGGGWGSSLPSHQSGNTKEQFCPVVPPADGGGINDGDGPRSSGVSTAAAKVMSHWADGVHKPHQGPKGVPMSRNGGTAEDAKAAASQAGSDGGNDTLRHYIEVNEGRKAKVYNDTKGHPTVGIGFNLDRGNARAVMKSLGIDYDKVRAGQAILTDAQINHLFDHDVRTATSDAKEVVGSKTFGELSEGRRIVVIDMVFNLGKAGLANFRKAISAIQQGNYNEAAKQMKDSAWYGQVGDRAKRNVEMMRSGDGPADFHEPEHGGSRPSTHVWHQAPALSDVRSGLAVLKLGQEGPAIKKVQTILDLAVDGRFGPGTERAVKDFQRLNHLVADGVIGSASLKALETRHSTTPSGGAPAHDQGAGGVANTEEHAGDVPGYADIEKQKFQGGIPGGGVFTWHNALWLPSDNRHAKKSEVSTEILANIARQAQALSKVSAHFGKPLSIHCWLRPPAYNAKIGGAKNSAHLRGSATDFHMSGLTAEQVRKEIRATPGLYPGAGETGVSWVHLDLEHTKWFGK